MNIIEFIEKRIAEDEESARACAARHFHPVVRYTGMVDVEAHYKPVAESGHFAWFTAHHPGFDPQYAAHIVRHDPARVLRQCAALRTIVEDLADDQLPQFELTLKVIAAIWSDHPDYQEGWRS